MGTELTAGGRRGLAREAHRASRDASTWRAEEALLVAAVVGSVLALGSVHRAALAAVALLAGAAFFAGSAPRRLPAPSLGLLALAAYSLLQAVPLPFGLVAKLAPKAAEIWLRNGELFAGAPRFVSLSLDPGASAIEALRFSIYAAVFAVAARVAERRGSAAFAAWLALGAALTAAVVTLAHGLLGATHVYGFYDASFTVQKWHVGPLLNPNNLAGYLTLGATAGLGLILRYSGKLRTGAAIAVMVVIAVEVISGSRGGLIAQALGAIAVVGLALARRRPRSQRSTETPTEEGDSSRDSNSTESRWKAIPALGLVLAGAVVLAALGGTTGTWTELFDPDSSKLRMPFAVAPMLRDFPIFGVGRGAFESAFQAYNAERGYSVWTHAESFPSQWMSEWGAPIGAAAVVLFLYRLWPTRLRVFKDGLSAALWAGLGCLLLQNIYDLGLEIPGVAIGVVAIWGALEGASRGAESSRNSRQARVEAPTRPILVWASSAVAAVSLVTGVAFGGHDVASDRYAEKTALADLAKGATSHAAFHSGLELAASRHPADPYFPLLGAIAAFKDHDPRAMDMLGFTLERGKNSPRAHLFLAEVLASRGARAQSMMELRFALTGDPALVFETAERAVRWTTKEAVSEARHALLLDAAPEGKLGARALDKMAARLPVGDDARSRLDAEAIARDPSLPGPHQNDAEDLLFALDKHSPRCPDQAACAAAIRAHADVIAAALPDQRYAAELKARVLVQMGKTDEAEALLASRCPEVSDRRECLLVRASFAIQLDASRAATSLKELELEGCRVPGACADTLTSVGDMWLNRGDADRALMAYSRACREETTKGRLKKLADAATRAGAHDRAADALARLARLGDDDPELDKRLRQERARTLEGL
jgi:hypothetical protein